MHIKVGSNVEITIEEGASGTGPGRVSRGSLRPGQSLVSSGAAPHETKE